MKSKNSFLSGTSSVGGDENLPPVRGGTTLVGSTKTVSESAKKNKKSVPRDYKEWDK